MPENPQSGTTPGARPGAFSGLTWHRHRTRSRNYQYGHGRRGRTTPEPLFSRRITREHLATIQSLAAAIDPTSAGSGSSRRPVPDTFEFDPSIGLDPNGVICQLRAAIVAETGLPFRSTGSSDLAAAEGHVSAGLLRPPDGLRVADSGYFAGREVYDLPLRLKVASCPGVRCPENQALYRWCWLGLPKVLGISAAVADAREPIHAHTDFQSIHGIGPKRAEYLKAYFDQSGPSQPRAFAGPGQTLGGGAEARLPSQDELRKMRLERFG